MSININTIINSGLIKKIILYFMGIFLILCGLAVIVYAVYPIGKYYLSSRESENDNKIAIRLPTEEGETDQVYKNTNVEIPDGNKLIIPKIGVEANIVEGDGNDSLWRGVWRYPTSAIPGDKGNVVISGHRFQFMPPNNRTFYLLDKLEPGDNIRIFWHYRSYEYKVKKKFEVDPDEVDVLKKGNIEKLTLLTCSPLFTQKKRLIIEALPRKMF